MATKIQRRALWYMLDHGGEMKIVTGYKAMRLTKILATREPVIACSANTWGGLEVNGYIEYIDPSNNMYRITEKGRKAAGRTRP